MVIGGCDTWNDIAEYGDTKVEHLDVLEHGALRLARVGDRPAAPLLILQAGENDSAGALSQQAPCG